MSNPLIIVSEFNKVICDALLLSCLAELERLAPQKNKPRVEMVPGAFELPFAAEIALADPQIEGAILLGCVVRGQTPHFDFVCQQTAAGVMQVGLKYKKPTIFGVLTVDTWEQAEARCGLSLDDSRGQASKKTNTLDKGIESARAYLSMVGYTKRWGNS